MIQRLEHVDVLGKHVVRAPAQLGHARGVLLARIHVRLVALGQELFLRIDLGDGTPLLTSKVVPEAGSRGMGSFLIPGVVAAAIVCHFLFLFISSFAAVFSNVPARRRSVCFLMCSKMHALLAEGNARIGSSSASTSRIYSRLALEKASLLGTG